MQLRPAQVQFVLAQGLPVVVEVRGASMTPTLAVGEPMQVRPAPARPGAPDVIKVGDVVLVITTGAEHLLVHRVMHVFNEGDKRFIAHQGDAPGSTFAICPRDAVLGKVVGFEADPARPLPTVAQMTTAERATFRRRAAVSAWYCRARTAIRALRLHDRKLARVAAKLYRKVTRVVGS